MLESLYCIRNVEQGWCNAISDILHGNVRHKGKGNLIGELFGELKSENGCI